MLKILVSFEDEYLLDNYKWYIRADGYPQTRFKKDGKRITKKLHKMIMSERGYVDHINGNKLDNRRCNLRYCTLSQNNANSKKHRDGFCKYKGVTYEKKKRLYRARIRVNGKLIGLGRYKNEEDAARAYNEAALKYFKEFAKINKVEEIT